MRADDSRSVASFNRVTSNILSDRMPARTDEVSIMVDDHEAAAESIKDQGTLVLFWTSLALDYYYASMRQHNTCCQFPLISDLTG